MTVLWHEQLVVCRGGGLLLGRPEEHQCEGEGKLKLLVTSEIVVIGLGVLVFKKAAYA